MHGAFEGLLFYFIDISNPIQRGGCAVHLISDENQLGLWWQQDNTWQDATQSCETPTPYQRDILNKQISLPVCRTGRLALFGPTNQLFL